MLGQQPQQSNFRNRASAPQQELESRAWQGQADRFNINLSKSGVEKLQADIAQREADILDIENKISAKLKEVPRDEKMILAFEKVRNKFVLEKGSLEEMLFGKKTIN